MIRTFTKDLGANHPKGKVCNYPMETWDRIAKAAGKSLDSFSTLVKTDGNINDRPGKERR